MKFGTRRAFLVDNMMKRCAWGGIINREGDVDNVIWTTKPIQPGELVILKCVTQRWLPTGLWRVWKREDEGPLVGNRRRGWQKNWKKKKKGGS